MRRTGRIAVVSIFIVIVLAWHGFYLLYDFEPAYTFLIEEKFYIWDIVFIPVLAPFFWWLGKQYDLAKFLSDKDFLTGLANRRYTFDYFCRMTKNNANTVQAVTVDINHFKQINDGWGHAAGDEALIRLAQILRQCVGSRGLASRWGGDEFVLLLRNASRDDAVQLTDRLSAQVQDLFEPFRQVEAGISTGIAGYPEDAGTFDELVKMADLRLYEHKNRIKA